MIISTTAKQKCDVHNCKNDAQVFFAVKGRFGRCYLCRDCLNKLASEAVAASTPKSPKNTIKRLADTREFETNTSMANR